MFFICVYSAKAQLAFDYIHSAGVGGYLSSLVPYPAIEYVPRLNFYEIDQKTAFSVETRITGGYYLKSGTYTDKHNFAFYIPLLFNYNSGCGATRVSDRTFGYYGGIGGAYNIYYNYSDLGSFNNFGPMVDAGIRFDIGDAPFEVGVGYMFDLSDNRTGIFSAGVRYIFNLLR